MMSVVNDVMGSNLALAGVFGLKFDDVKEMLKKSAEGMMASAKDYPLEKTDNVAAITTDTIANQMRSGCIAAVEKVTEHANIQAAAQSAGVDDPADNLREGVCNRFSNGTNASNIFKSNAKKGLDFLYGKLTSS